MRKYEIAFSTIQGGFRKYRICSNLRHFFPENRSPKFTRNLDVILLRMSVKQNLHLFIEYTVSKPLIYRIFILVRLGSWVARYSTSVPFKNLMSLNKHRFKLLTINNIHLNNLYPIFKSKSKHVYFFICIFHTSLFKWGKTSCRKVESKDQKVKMV